MKKIKSGADKKISIIPKRYLWNDIMSCSWFAAVADCVRFKSASGATLRFQLAAIPIGVMSRFLLLVRKFPELEKKSAFLQMNPVNVLQGSYLIFV